MTLVVAIKCKDGVVIASDSAASDSETGIKQPMEKIKQLGNHPILYGASADVGLLQKLNEELQTFTPKSNFKNILKEIKKLVVPELKESAMLHVPYPQQGFYQPPVAVLLFAGVTDGEAWILEIERDGRDTRYGEDLGDFAAIGSGKPWAQAVFRPHLFTERDLKLGKIFAYRVVEDSIELASGGLAKPINMFTISIEGKVEQISRDELEGLVDTCEVWRDQERKAVGELLAPKIMPEETPEIPKPD